MLGRCPNFSPLANGWILIILTHLTPQDSLSYMGLCIILLPSRSIYSVSASKSQSCSTEMTVHCCSVQQLAIHWCFPNSSTRHEGLHYRYSPFILLSFLTRKRSGMYLQTESVAIPQKTNKQKRLTKVLLQDLIDHKRVTPIGTIAGIITVMNLETGS